NQFAKDRGGKSRSLDFFSDFTTLSHADAIRLADIACQVSAWSSANRRTKGADNLEVSRSRFLHSPLAILRRALTQPGFIEFESYADAIIRALIFEAAFVFFGTKVDRSDALQLIQMALQYDNLADAMSCIRSLNREVFSFIPKTMSEFIIAHLL